MGAWQVAERVEIFGWFGVAATSHWLSSQAAMSALEGGGNAFDGAVAAGFAMQVAQPHLNGPAGDVSILLHNGRDRTVEALCGQGPAPASATISAMVELGLDLIPGTGLLPAVVPGAFDAWMCLLRERGTMRLGQVLAPAILYAERGIPVDDRLSETLNASEPIFHKHWPTSVPVYLAADHRASGRFANPILAATWRRLLAEAEAASSDRDDQIETARAIWSDGFIASAIDSFCRVTEVIDISGRPHGAFLRGSDLSGWRAGFEKAVAMPFAGRTVHKCGAWTQGPAMLSALSILDGSGIDVTDPNGAEFVHLVTEALKLALADRDAHLGDHPSAQAALEQMLSPAYNEARRELIGADASDAFRAGKAGESDWAPDFAAALLRQREAGILASYGGGEPTVKSQEEPTAPKHGAHLSRAVGDTSYIAIADSDGNVVSATPSGGWLQSSPAIPELGFPLGTRAQMMWLDPASPSALVPGARPRTTLTPTLVTGADGDALATGTPGGDQQEQWQTAFLVRHLMQGASLQEAIDAPGFHTNHVINSFFPRGATRAALVLEERFPESTVEELRRRGHEVTRSGPWSEGRLCAVSAAPDGALQGAATSRGGQSLAVGR